MFRPVTGHHQVDFTVPQKKKIVLGWGLSFTEAKYNRHVFHLEKGWAGYVMNQRINLGPVCISAWLIVTIID